MDTVRYECWPIPIIRYMEMIKNVYTREQMMYLVRWKLRDNYTYTRPEEN